ncbi:MAG TPA: hypothetical protein VG387_09690 [Rhizomicrobium sp.]|nr:hypothetical protein [Rhizomicrobium sp.]
MISQFPAATRVSGITTHRPSVTRTGASPAAMSPSSTDRQSAADASFAVIPKRNPSHLPPSGAACSPTTLLWE